MTGAVASDWHHGLQDFQSQVEVLATARMNRLSWQRTTARAPGLGSCLRDSIVKGAPPRWKVRSFTKIAPPHTGPCVAAFRAVIDYGDKTTGSGRWVAELIGACRGRASVSLYTIAPASDQEQVSRAASRGCSPTSVATELPRRALRAVRDDLAVNSEVAPPARSSGRTLTPALDGDERGFGGRVALNVGPHSFEATRRLVPGPRTTRSRSCAFEDGWFDTTDLGLACSGRSRGGGACEAPPSVAIALWRVSGRNGPPCVVRGLGAR